MLQVFERVARNVVVGAMDGFNGTIFAYGQTGSGTQPARMRVLRTPNPVVGWPHYAPKHFCCGNVLL